MPVNETIEAILAKMNDLVDAIGAIDNSTIVDAINISNEKLQAIVDVSGNIYEKVNTIEFNTAQIAEYLNQIRGWTVEEDVHAIRVATDDIIGPILEAIMFNGREANANLRVLSCLCELTGMLPLVPGTMDPPDDTDLHCQRSQYLIYELRNRVTTVRGWIANGVAMGNETIAYLFGFNFLVGVDDSIVSPDLRLGFAGLLAAGADILLQALENWLTTYGPALVEILYLNTNATAAKNGMDSYIDSNLPDITDGPLRTAIKALLNQGVVNLLYDQSVDWNVSDYDDDACGDSGDFSTFESVLTTICTYDSGGGGLSRHLPDQHRLYLNGMPDDTFHWEPYWSIDSGDFFEGADIGAVAKWLTWVVGNFHNYRIRYVDGINTIGIYRDEEIYENLGELWWRFPDDEHAWAIVNDTSASFFTVQVQRFVDGIWTNF